MAQNTLFLFILFYTNKYNIFTHSPIMKAVSLIDDCLCERIEFLESLLIISSYQDIVAPIPKKLQEESDQLTDKQTQTILQILRTLRIDDSIKKDLHKIILRNFKRIDSRYNARREPTGATKDLVGDYTNFFLLMKEKNILQFLSQIFDIHIYSQTTIVYVLIEILLKFLRLKCTAFIREKIKGSAFEVQEKKQSPSLNDSFFINNKKMKLRPSRNYSESNSQHSRLKSMPNALETQKIVRRSIRQYNKQKQRQSLQVNCHTIPTDLSEKREVLSRLRSRKVSFSQNKQSISNSVKTKRRVIKSFLNVKKETNQRIERNNSLMREWVGSGMQNYLKIFCKVYQEQWNHYLKLVCLEVKNDEDPISYSCVKKKEWMIKNQEKMMFEACSRNDEIRKEMEIYADLYNSKFKQ